MKSCFLKEMECNNVIGLSFHQPVYQCTTDARAVETCIWVAEKKSSHPTVKKLRLTVTQQSDGIQIIISPLPQSRAQALFISQRSLAVSHSTHFSYLDWCVDNKIHQAKKTGYPKLCFHQSAFGTWPILKVPKPWICLAVLIQHVDRVVTGASGVFTFTFPAAGNNRGDITWPWEAAEFIHLLTLCL